MTFSKAGRCLKAFSGFILQYQLCTSQKTMTTAAGRASSRVPLCYLVNHGQVQACQKPTSSNSFVSKLVIMNTSKISTFPLFLHPNSNTQLISTIRFPHFFPTSHTMFNGNSRIRKTLHRPYIYVV